MSALMRGGAILIGLACQARAGIIEPDQVWTSGPVLYTWVLTEDYGYQPISLDGVPVNGITFGFNPMPLDGSGESSPAPIPFVAPPVVVPTSAPEETPPVITPEPSGVLLLIVGMGLMAGSRRSAREVPAQEEYDTAVAEEERAERERDEWEQLESGADRTPPRE